MTSRRSRSDRNRRVAQAPEERRAAVRRVSAASEDEREPGTTADANADAENDTVEEADEAHSKDRRSGGVNAVLRLLGAGLLFAALPWRSLLALIVMPDFTRFAVRQIEVDGIRRVTREAILERAGIRTGQNVFSVDTDALGQKIITDRWYKRSKSNGVYRQRFGSVSSSEKPEHWRWWVTRCWW